FPHLIFIDISNSSCGGSAILGGWTRRRRRDRRHGGGGSFLLPSRSPSPFTLSTTPAYFNSNNDGLVAVQVQRRWLPSTATASTTSSDSCGLEGDDLLPPPLSFSPKLSLPLFGSCAAASSLPSAT
ncbi:hypothetical protein S83_010302, partial [Arachis hypogaea]